MTGGYKKADGSYELTFLTPSSALDDFPETVDIFIRVLAVKPESVEALGLEALATNARNTLQHGEVWTEKDIIKAFSSGGASQKQSGPLLTMYSSAPFITPLNAQSTIEATVTKNLDGSFTVQTRVERVPAAEQNTNSHLK